MPLPDDVGGQPLEEYILRFDRELQAIARNTEALAQLNDPQGLIPSTLNRIEKQMAETFAYQGAGPTRAPGVTAGETGRSPSASSSDDKAIEKLLYPGGRSKTASVGGNQAWLGSVDANQQFKLPQFGALTLQDKINYVAGMFANKAAGVRENTTEWKNLEELRKDPKSTQEQLDTAFAALNELPRGGGGGRWSSAGAANALGVLSGGYAGGKAISGLVNQVFTNPMVNARNLAYLSGYQGGGQGFMGLPNLGAVRAGVGQRVSEMGFAFHNRVSPGQAEGIYNNLFGLGWFGGSSTNAMRQGLAQITQTNPLLGTNPQVASMMDQATRMGQSSISQFVDVMKQVPAAANAAHLSLSQVINDASALGQYYKGIGGTVTSGYQAATSFNAVSGLPAGVFQQLLQNPMVKGQVFMGSGLMPWEQGNASFGNQMGGIFNAMNLFSKAVHLPPVTQHDSLGLTRQVSSTDRTASLMSHYFGIDQATVKNMMQHQQGIIAGTNLEQNASDYMAAVRSGHLRANDPAWGKLFHQVMVARDWNGKPMFTAKQQRDLTKIAPASDQQILDWMQQHGPEGQTGLVGGRGRAGKAAVPRMGNWIDAQQYAYGRAHGGATESQAQLVTAAIKSGRLDPSLMPGSLAKNRADAIKKIIGQHTQSANQGPQITIGLSGTAAKLFKLSSNTAQGKAKANAGGSSVNIPYGQGPSDAALSANPETSGVSSNPTWGSSAGQSPNWETP